MTDLQIQYFLKVAQHLSYTAAARELFVSQPSLSKQVAALERELGVALFDRSRRNRIALTPAGHLFQRFFAPEFRFYVRQIGKTALRVIFFFKAVFFRHGELYSSRLTSMPTTPNSF